MKSIAAPVFAFAVSALFAACTASRPVSGPPTPADETAYYTTRPTQRLGEKRILPDPINGLGQTNDPHIRVTDIQQTDRYTVLYLSFGSDNKRSTLDFYGSSASDISIQSGAYLVARGGEQKFKLLKADGIPFSPDSKTVQSGEQVDFLLYFERMPDTVSHFAMYECESTSTQTCWNIIGMKLRPDQN
jgi:hypothetical protein